MRFIRLLKEPRKVDLGDVEAAGDRIAGIAKKFSLSLLYIYGSLAGGRMGPLSDIDIAVECIGEKELSLEEYLGLLSDIQGVFGREDIDLVQLKQAPPLLKMRILQHGKLVYFKDEESLIKFRKLAISSYLRTSSLRKVFFKYMKEAVLKEDDK